MNQLPYNPKLKPLAAKLRKAGNLSEVIFWCAVKDRQYKGLDFDRQKVIGNYIVDFYCAKMKLVVEIDGESHSEKAEYDAVRHKYLEDLGLTVIHFLDNDIKQNLKGVFEYLEKHAVFNE